MVRWMSEGGMGSYAVNPQCAREKRVPITPALIKKKVVIAGGGPAGLEAARVSALRGHEVTLFEGGNRLGGALLVGGQPDFKKEDIALADWYSRELDKLHVTVKLNTKADKDAIMALHPDVVVTAEGSHPVKLSLPGVDSEKTAFAEDILTGKKTPGNDCVIIGGGLVGCGLALDLLNKGKNVSIVEALPDILSAGAPNCLFNEVALRDLLKLKEAAIYMNSKADSITETGVVIATPDGKKEISADTVVLAVGYRPE